MLSNRVEHFRCFVNHLHLSAPLRLKNLQSPLIYRKLREWQTSYLNIDKKISNSCKKAAVETGGLSGHKKFQRHPLVDGITPDILGSMEVASSSALAKALKMASKRW